MKGIPLCSLEEQLVHVQPEHEHQPIQSFISSDKLAKIQDFYHHFPAESFSRLSFDRLCKIYFSSKTTIHAIDRIFENSPHHDLVRKIMSSFWRWSYSRGTWNEVVDAYDNIRNFNFGMDPDFQIRLDYAKYSNESGYSKFSDTFLDGAFGFLLFYKGEHVMTIGFSILSEKRILIQQVQLTKQSGNRFLYKLPKNRLEFVINLFKENFSGYLLHIINPRDLNKKIASEYKASLKRWSESPEKSSQIKEAIRHLQADKKRLILFYENTGRFMLKKKIRVTANGLTHFQIPA